MRNIDDYAREVLGHVYGGEDGINSLFADERIKARLLAHARKVRVSTRDTIWLPFAVFLLEHRPEEIDEEAAWALLQHIMENLSYTNPEAAKEYWRRVNRENPGLVEEVRKEITDLLSSP